ncbi:hypothetical protein PoB_004268000 [Plakobranchus ocellatus]|uniref:Uncharacterized protein n=1 Tax=Plakobranchus ocellatus TaxID=259542 RepID=A0AAV4B9I4_9GAST|nr:hypothetical protein PoB_004268000 [Plakobranchus ocellatus]
MRDDGACTHGSLPVHDSSVGRSRAASPHQRDLRRSGPPSGVGDDGKARIREKMFLADLRADSLYIVLPT